MFADIFLNALTDALYAPNGGACSTLSTMFAATLKAA